MKHQLQKVIFDHLPLSPEEWKFLEARIHTKSLKKGEKLLTSGEISRAAYFIHRGILRNFLTHDNKEVTLFFAFENDLAIPYEFFSRAPAESCLQALTKSEVLLIHYDDLQAFFELSANTQKLGRLLMEQLFLKEKERSKTMLTLRPQDYYSHIEKEQPQLIHRIQSQHLASYMGITRESLSRIKKRRSKSV